MYPESHVSSTMCLCCEFTHDYRSINDLVVALEVKAALSALECEGNTLQ